MLLHTWKPDLFLLHGQVGLQEELGNMKACLDVQRATELAEENVIGRTLQMLTDASSS